MSSTHLWPSSRLSDLPRTSYSRRTFVIGLASMSFTLWSTKSRSSNFDLYFAYYPIDMAGKCTIGFYPLTTIVTVEWSYFVFRLYYVIAYSDLYRRLASKAFTLWWTNSRLSDFDSYFIYYPTDLAGICTTGLTSKAFINWWPSSRLNDFTSYFTYITSYPSRTCIVWLVPKAFTLWWTKSRLNDFDLFFTYYPADNNRHGWVSLPRISLILRHILVGLVVSDLPWRRSRSDEQSQSWVVLTRISLIIQQIWMGSASSDTSRWRPHIDHHRHCWGNLPRIFHFFLSYHRQTSIIALASKAYMLWWTKWRLKYFDAKFADYTQRLTFISVITTNITKWENLIKKIWPKCS